jgi:hypothetical protein
MRRPLLTTVAVALVVTIAGCSDDDAGDRATTTSEAGTGSSEVTGDAEEPTTTLPEAAVEVVLRGDGLGVVELGAPPDEVVEALTDALGAPTRDTGWEPAFSEYGTCPGEQIRGVEWDHLVLLFTDGATELGQEEHLFAWRVTGAPPAVGTATGFGFGATAADAEELYPGRVELVPAEEPFPAFLVVEAEGGTITAYLDEDDVVTNLEAGVPCGE